MFGKCIAMNLAFVDGMFRSMVFRCMVEWHMAVQSSQERYHYCLPLIIPNDSMTILLSKRGWPLND